MTHWASHDPRRTGRTVPAALGCLDVVAERLLGHVQAGVEGVYNRHVDDAQRRGWLTRLPRHLEGLAAAG